MAKKQKEGDRDSRGKVCQPDAKQNVCRRQIGPPTPFGLRRDSLARFAMNWLNRLAEP